MKLHYFQHVAFEGLGLIEGWATSRHHTVTSTQMHRSQKLPPMDEVDMLVVMGGPMGATDDQRLPWMRAEKLFIEESMKRGKKVLGICLGAQMIADVLGARVHANREREIGWFPIELDPPNARNTALRVLDQRHTVFHWHGDTFDLPAGSLHLARSQACENQAFSVNDNVLALQFHLEMGLGQIESIVAGCANELIESSFVQPPKEIFEYARSHAYPLEMTLTRFLDSFVAN